MLRIRRRTRATYITELQRQALCGLQLCGAQVHVPGGGEELLLRGRGLLLRLVHGRGQGEVQGAAGLLRLAHVDGAVTRHVLQTRTHLEQHLVTVLVDVCTDWESRVIGRAVM